MPLPHLKRDPLTPELDKGRQMLADLSEAEYQGWRHHPVSRLLLNYLDDYANGLERQLVANWYAGQMTDEMAKEARGRALVARELGNLSLADLQGFY